MHFLSYAVALEEISRADAGVGVFLSVHSSAATYPLHDWGSEELKKKYMPQLASGKKIGAFALTETEAGSDAGGTKTTAVLDGDEYVINGEKIYITNAPYADIYSLRSYNSRNWNEGNFSILGRKRHSGILNKDYLP